MKLLKDDSGRRMRKLRVALTECCNLRCFHCMKDEIPAVSPGEWLTPANLEQIVRSLAALGVDQVRLTGGEPTLRPELLEIVERLGRLRLRRLGITSNGVLLEPMLPALKAAGLRNLNLSLDSLDPEVFARITGSPDHTQVLATLQAARARALEVKVNMVVFRGLNDHEVPHFVRLAEREQVAVRFLELMRIGPDHAANRRFFVPASETMQQLREAGFHLRRRSRPVDATAREYCTDKGGRIGFIASETRPFCGTCSRLRLSASGILRACLMREEGLSLKHVAPDAIPELARQTLAWKPLERLSHTDRPMVRIGG